MGARDALIHLIHVIARAFASTRLSVGRDARDRAF